MLRRKSLSFDKSPVVSSDKEQRRCSLAYGFLPYAGERGFLCSHHVDRVLKGERKERHAEGAVAEGKERRGSIVQRWLRHISEAADAYKNKDHFGKNRRLDLTVSSPQSPPDSEAAEETSEKNKELEESSHDADTIKSSSNDLETSGTSQDGGDSVPSNESSQTSVGTATSTSTTTTATPQSSPLLSRQPDGGDQGKRSAESSPSHRTIIEQLRLSTVENSLIQPSEVVVSQKSVMTAEPVLTPLEQLRLKDEAIRRALSEKQQLVAEILHIPKGEFETIADIAAEPSIDKEATELILAAVNQANQLAAALNDSLKVTEEEAIVVTSEVHPGSSPRSGRRKSRLPGVPTHKLQGISVCLNSQLTQLLRIVKERDEERERLRRELQRSRELIHFLHEMNRKSPKSEVYYRLPEDAIQESGDLMPDTGIQVISAAEESTSNDLSQQNLENREGKSDPGNEVFVDALSGDNDTLDNSSERREDLGEEQKEGNSSNDVP